MALPGIRSDPFPGFNFQVVLIDDSSKLATALTAVSVVMGGSFSECSGLEGTLQLEEYPEGGENRFVHKFATRMTYANISLRRGITFSEDLWNWHFDYVNGRGKRRDGMIFLKNELQIPLKMWVWRAGLPVKWSGPTFNATQNAVAIEGLEIAHQGLELVSPGSIAQQVGNQIAAQF